jgi:hypothetical protein
MINVPMKFFKLPLLFVALLAGCVGSMNPTGGNSRPDYPYFVTTKPLVVKKIPVPVGTTLVYEESWFKKGKQDKMLSESKLTAINLPEGETILWGGVPVTRIAQFFNSKMRGFNVSADFSKLTKAQQNRFTEMWQSCDDNLGIAIKNRDDWSFNLDNIVDVQSCSVLYQRYFKNNKEQQRFLDEMYRELRNSTANHVSR